ncbi:maturation protein [ssRNA phage SRR6050738_2]|uniref:Maturation protein n=1 Tax=ssRNA phage SRR6050738_2 TaxID=2786485 RepID=A0A8S5L3K6_9VIRU|nr:maturation protein [ssRNA phage SRR6050738_2]DAD52249.1 TPA_asm: maturation protein [ssRNA phage SRR6050738_2]
MPYESKFITSSYENIISGIHASPIDGTPVRATYSRSGEIPTKSFQRVGSNNPLNGPLLAYMKKSKPLRVRSYIKKVITGYRYIYKKVAYDKWKPKKVFSHYVYTYREKYVRRISRSGEIIWKKKLVRKRHKRFRYILTVKVRFYKIRIRVPVKTRVRIYFTLPPKVVSELPTGRPYLLPNSLLFSTASVSVKPLHNSSTTAVQLYDDIYFLNAETTGPAYSRIPFPGTAPLGFNVASVTIGRGLPSASDYIPFLPAVDDIYLSATSLHGLYKKVASDVPSTLTSLAELPETISAVYRILTDGIKLAKALRKADLRSAWKSLNRATIARQDSLSGVSSKVWLSWYLAISPTISDISEHIETYKRSDRVWREFKKSSREMSSTVTEDESGFYNQVNLSNTVKWSCIINGRLQIDQLKEKFSASQNQTGALYAIVPFSFIADWIIDISTYLESAHIFQDLDYDAWKTTATSRDEVIKSFNIGYNNQQLSTETIRARTDVRNTVIINQATIAREPISELPDMPLIPWKKKLVTETQINRSLTAAALFRLLSSKKN